MDEKEIRALTIQPPQVKRILKLLQKETTIDALLSIFEKDWGFDIFADYRGRLLTALNLKEEYRKKQKEQQLRAIDAEDKLRTAQKTIDEIKRLIS